MIPGNFCQQELKLMRRYSIGAMIAIWVITLAIMAVGYYIFFHELFADYPP